MDSLKYIGPFLRINNINTYNIKNQMFHLSKESIKHLVLFSRCGITLSLKDLKLKNMSNIDISTFKENSPLLCIYKKSNSKIIHDKNTYFWDEDSFKKEINIASNGYMTLCLLELIDYYKKFEGIDKDLFSLNYVYASLCKLQLDFYSSYLRNEEGVFIDKNDISDDITKELRFEDKNKKFKFSDQALMMNAYYKYSELQGVKDAEAYKNFALDILNMLMEYRYEIYEVSFEENIKLCMNLNIFYKYSNMGTAKELLMDMTELMVSRLKDRFEGSQEIKIDYLSLCLINLLMFHKNTGIQCFDSITEKAFKKLTELYDPEENIIIKSSDKKEVDYSSQEVVLYILSLSLHSWIADSNDTENILSNIYRTNLVNSGMILSWPEVPTLNSPERYRYFSLKSEDLLEESDFKMPTVPSLESAGAPPIFVKYITFNKKKKIFTAKKTSFDSTKNLNLLFYMLYITKLFL